MKKRTRWTTEKIKEEAIKYSNRSDFQKFSCGAYNAALKRGILDEVCSHMKTHSENLSGDRNPAFKWTFEKLQEEALKYNSKKVFLLNSPAAYQAAYKRGILEEICAHMEESNKRWVDNVKNIYEEALKYSSRAEFSYNSSGAYCAAIKMNILDEVCKHMKKDSCSRMEKELCVILKSKFSSAKKFRDHRVLIQNKPYIKRFEIDIFIPELNLGIEFDGDYYHSFEYMRKDKKKKLWSDDDIYNYHEIKDTWFLSKGIKILHIKEKDWIKNKRACVDKVLEFLGVEQKKVV